MGDVQSHVNWSEIGFMATLVGFLGVLFLGVPLDDTLLTVGVFAMFGALGLLAGGALEFVRLSRRCRNQPPVDSPGE